MCPVPQRDALAKRGVIMSSPPTFQGLLWAFKSKAALAGANLQAQFFAVLYFRDVSYTGDNELNSKNNRQESSSRPSLMSASWAHRVGESSSPAEPAPYSTNAYRSSKLLWAFSPCSPSFTKGIGKPRSVRGRYGNVPNHGSDIHPLSRYHRLFDVSKQVLGQMFVHGLNVLISDLGSHHSAGNACTYYFLNILLDTTLGALYRCSDPTLVLMQLCLKRC